MQTIMCKIVSKAILSLKKPKTKGSNMKNKKDRCAEKECERTLEFPTTDNSGKHEAPESRSSINNPQRNLPAYNPPIPNRAWTEMRQDLMNGLGRDSFSTLTPDERADLYPRPKKY